MGRRRIYTKEFKESAIELYHRSGEKTRKEVAEGLGINPENLGRWLREEKEAGTSNIRVFPGHGNPRDEELAQLKKEVADLRETNEILKKAMGLLCGKKPPIAAYLFMKEHKGRYGVSKTARVLGVSRSGYYAWEKRKPSRHEEEDGKLSILISKIFKEHHGRYGSPRVWEELKERGIHVSRKRVERLMRENKLSARRRRKTVHTTDSNHRLEVADNILNREFSASFPGEKWVSDITYLRTDKGWLYLTTVLDLWDRKVIGWSMSEDMTAEQACRALDMAVKNRMPPEGLIFHSDRGVQYCSEEFRSYLKRLCPSVRQSMSRKGNCWDNACAESFFKTLKTELDILRKGGSAEQIKTAVFEYIEAYYNRRRRHSAIGYAIPIALTSDIAA